MSRVRAALRDDLNAAIPVCTDRDPATVTIRRGRRAIKRVEGTIVPSSYWAALQRHAKPGDLIEIRVAPGRNARLERMRVVEAVHPHTHAKVLGYMPVPISEEDRARRCLFRRRMVESMRAGAITSIPGRPSRAGV